MEEKKLDLRIQKTYLALTRSLLEMMCEMPFDKIRVVDLCDRAMIRKSTFYKHFADKYELLIFCVRQRRDEALAKVTDTDPIHFYNHFLDAVFAFIHENEAFFQNAVDSSSFPVVIQALSEELIPGIRQYLVCEQKKGNKLPMTPENLAPFFVGGIMETIRSWYLGGSKTSEESVRAEILALVDAICVRRA